MNDQKEERLSISQFYRQLRPENFSDSESHVEFKLPYEVLAYELEKISTNQKQDEFEVLCRKLAENFVSPNLIPQVGPTGGGDGKTDFETHALSEIISDKWFIPSNGWQKDEKWAFAISSKKAWKPKLIDDVKKIVDTKRGYTKIFFMTNQVPSSKAKKDVQEELFKKFNIEVTLLDAKWILEKIYQNDLTHLAVESLNLSQLFKEEKQVLGSNDKNRRELLVEVEERIQQSNRYFEYDFLLVDDAIEAAILSRMIELPKDQVIGKFERAIRLCRKVNNDQQWVRIYYQYAWTAINWYDDYFLFLDNYNKFKKFLDSDSGINELEHLYTLFNLLKNIKSSALFDLEQAGIIITEERNFLLDILNRASQNFQRPSRSLSARTFRVCEELFTSLVERKSCESHIVELIEIFQICESYLDYDFESFKKNVLVFGDLLSDSKKFDDLIDTIAVVNEKRTSAVSAGKMFLKRATQKFEAKLYKDAIIYFGKAVVKLAKDDNQDGIYLVLKGLANCYELIGLYWAANICLVAATSIALKSWYNSGVITNKAYNSVKELLKNELFIGRIPSIINWYELLDVLAKQLNVEQENDQIPDLRLADSCLAVRLLNSRPDELSGFLPNIFEHSNLPISQDAALFALGHIDQLFELYKQDIGIKDKDSIHELFEKLSEQPFREQIVYPTSLMVKSDLHIHAIILGCRFNVFFKKNSDLLIVSEMIMGFLEIFLSTSLEDVFPSSEQITITLEKIDSEELFIPIETGSNSHYKLQVGRFIYLPEDQERLWDIFIPFIADVIGRNFLIKNMQQYLKQLFAKEEISERMALVFEHIKFSNNILGNNPKVFLEDRVKSNYSELECKDNQRPISVKMNSSSPKVDEEESAMPNFDTMAHNHRRVMSIFDNKLWDDAGWKAFGNASYADGKFYLFLGFENIVAAEKIFDDWIVQFGQTDKDETIRIVIIKGIDEKNPYHYKISISKNFEKFKDENHFVIVQRGLPVQPVSSHNLDNLLKGFAYHKKYLLCPASFNLNTKAIDLRRTKAILKATLIVKHAWEIGLHDVDRTAITSDTYPVIPIDRKYDAPILELLKAKDSNGYRG